MMPVRSCQEDGKPGYKACGDCKCYTYTPGDANGRKQARDKAEAQLARIKIEQGRRRGS